MLRAALRLSHIWRTIDLSRPSNRLAVVSAAVVTVVGGLLVSELTDTGIGRGLLSGLGYGIGAFLAWSLGRELDPDRTATARAALLVYLVLAWLGPPDLAAVLAVLFSTRLVVRTTGRPPTTIDLVFLVALAAVAATSAPGFVTALGLAWALHVDRRLPEPADDRPAEVAAAVAAGLAVVATIVAGAFLDTWSFPRWYGLLVLIAVALAAVTLRTTTVTSLADRTHRPLSLERLVHARRLTLLVIGAAVCWAGAAALSALAPVIAAVVGAGLVSADAGSRLAAVLPRRGTH